MKIWILIFVTFVSLQTRSCWHDEKPVVYFGKGPLGRVRSGKQLVPTSALHTCGLAPSWRKKHNRKKTRCVQLHVRKTNSDHPRFVCKNRKVAHRRYKSPQHQRISSWKPLYESDGKSGGL